MLPGYSRTCALLEHLEQPLSFEHVHNVVSFSGILVTANIEQVVDHLSSSHRFQEASSIKMAKELESRTMPERK